MRSLHAVSCAIACCIGARAETIYVDCNAEGLDDGTSWANAFVDLQNALLNSKHDDEVWVTEGRYYPSSAGDRGVAFRIPSGVRLYGGFSGAELSRDQRDWDKYRTRLCGNIGDQRSRKDNSQRVVEVSNVDDGTIMDGFVIQNAWNDRDAPLGRGGGVYLEQARITISNCRIRKNYAGGGGGMWIQSSAPDLVDCTLVNNRGRGISSNDSHPRIAGCRFERNYTPSDGAGLGLFNGSTTSVVDSSFYLNRSDVDGGAYFGLDAASFVDCVFMGNTAHDWGGAVRQWRGPVELINCSFYDNSTNWWAGGISALDDATITNCIFWGNTGRRRDGEDAQVDFYGDHTVITNTLVEGWTGRWGGEGNFDANPKWVDAQKGNLRLRSNSPCIDAGTDDAVTEPTDLDGNPRILGGRVDIGAYENLCREVLDLAATVVEDDAEGHSGDGDGVCESGEDCIITATVAVDPATLPAGSTVRVTFTSVDKDGNPDVDPCCADRTCGPGAHCPTVRKARIDSAGQGIATLRQCPDGAVTVCIEGCGERLCRDVDCP